MSQPTLLEASSEDSGKFGLQLARNGWELIYHRHFEVEENDVPREEGSDEEERWSLGLTFTRRLNTLRREAKHLQYMFAVTSTLGGANHLCNRPVQALMMAKKQEEVGLRFGSESIVIRSRVFQAVNYALMDDVKTANAMFRNAYRKAREHNDEGIVNFTKAVHGWLSKELVALAITDDNLSSSSGAAAQIE